jgi:hypothetical protein
MSTTAQCYYKAARDEIILRLRLRDQVLLSYTVVGATVIGLSLSNISGFNNIVALIVPFLAVGASILISSHSIAITHLGSYTVQLKEPIDLCREHAKVEIEPWDYSSSYMYYSERNLAKRLTGHIVVIFIPAFFSLVVSVKNFSYPFDIHSSLWVAGVFLTVFSVLILIHAHLVRKREIDLRVHKYELQQQERQIKPKKMR